MNSYVKAGENMKFIPTEKAPDRVKNKYNRYVKGQSAQVQHCVPISWVTNEYVKEVKLDGF